MPVIQKGIMQVISEIKKLKKKLECLLYQVANIFLIFGLKGRLQNFRKRNSIFKYRFITNLYFHTRKKHNAIANSDSVSFKCMTSTPSKKVSEVRTA